MRGLRVAIVLESLELGGAERQALLLGGGLRDRFGCDVRVLGFRSPGRAAAMCDEAGLRWRCVDIVARRASGTPRWRRSAAALLGELRREPADVLLPYTATPNTLCGLVWHEAGARACVWSQRDSGVGLTGCLAQRLAIERVTGVVTNSGSGARVLGSMLGVPTGRAVLVPNAVALATPRDDRAAWRDRLGLRVGDLLACMVANLHSGKDHITAVRAWARVSAALQTRGLRGLLAFAGRDGYAAAGLVRSEIARRGLERDVVMLGPADDVAGLLAASDLSVFSSKPTEGCPNAVLEAMAAGRPVVATDLDGTRLALGPLGERLLVPQGDDAAIAAAVLELWGDPDRCARLGGALRERAERCFGLPAMIERTAAVIEDGLEDRSRAA